MRGQNPFFNQKDFEQLFHSLGPLVPKDMMQNQQNMNPAWIGEYVQNVLKQSFPGGTPNMGFGGMGGLFQYDTFETHRDVIVRVNVAEDEADQVRAYVSGNQLKLVKPDKQTQMIKLPELVNSSRTKAFYKDGVLEFRLGKWNDSSSFHEIRIRYS